MDVGDVDSKASKLAVPTGAELSEPLIRVELLDKAGGVGGGWGVGVGGGGGGGVWGWGGVWGGAYECIDVADKYVCVSFCGASHPLWLVLKGEREPTSFGVPHLDEHI